MHSRSASRLIGGAIDTEAPARLRLNKRVLERKLRDPYASKRA
jgi:hypothetical protein